MLARSKNGTERRDSSPVQFLMTSGSITSSPKTTKKPKTARDSSSTCTIWAISSISTRFDLLQPGELLLCHHLRCFPVVRRGPLLHRRAAAARDDPIDVELVVDDLSAPRAAGPAGRRPRSP